MEKDSSNVKKNSQAHLYHLQETGIIHFKPSEALKRKGYCGKLELVAPSVPEFGDKDQKSSLKVSLYVILHNPTAREGAGRKFLINLTQALKQNNILFEVIESKSVAFFMNFVDKFDFGNGRVLVISGGDGSVANCANAIYSRKDLFDNQRATISILPSGSGNLSAYSYGITVHTLTEVLKRQETRRYEVYRVTIDEADDETHTSRIVMAMFAVGNAATFLERSEKWPQFLPKRLRYVVSGLWDTFFDRTSIRVDIEVDGQVVLRDTPIFFHIMYPNQGGWGASPRFLPYSQINDGIINMLVLVDVVERLDKGKFFQEAKRGAHIYNEKCIYLRGRRITIWLHQSTRVIVDGEYLTAQKKITIAVETDKINIVC